MKKKLFNCDEELLELVNYTITNKDSYSFTFEFNGKLYTVSKSIEERKSMLEIETENTRKNKTTFYIDVNRKVEGDYVYDDWGEHITGYETNIYDILNIHSKTGEYYSTEYKQFDLTYVLNHNCINNRVYGHIGLDDIRTISLEELRTKPVIKFVYYSEVPRKIGGKIIPDRFTLKENKVNTDSTFSVIDNNYFFKRSFITDKCTSNNYSKDGINIVKLGTLHSDIVPSVIPSYEEICNIDEEKEASKLIEAISSKYPQYSTDYLKDMFIKYFKSYKEHFKYLYEDNSNKIKDAIKKRNVMLEEREKAPYLSKEVLSCIISQIKEHDNQLVMKRVSKNN